MTQTPTIIVHEKEKLAHEGAKLFLKIAKDSFQKNGRFICALAGGKSPEGLYQALNSYASEPFWQNTHVFTTDERFVPADHDYNNFRMIRINLLRDIKIPEKNLHPMPSGAVSPEAAAKFETKMQKFFNLKDGQFPQFDLILLGMGDDGHTASLFEVVPHWQEKKRLAITLTHPKIQYDRMSLTLPVLNNGRNVIFYVYGEGKAHILKKVLDKNGPPAAFVQPQNGRLYFLVDTSSAKMLDH